MHACGRGRANADLVLNQEVLRCFGAGCPASLSQMHVRLESVFVNFGVLKDAVVSTEGQITGLGKTANRLSMWATGTGTGSLQPKPAKEALAFHNIGLNDPTTVPTPRARERGTGKIKHAQSMVVVISVRQKHHNTVAERLQKNQYYFTLF